MIKALLVALVLTTVTPKLEGQQAAPPANSRAEQEQAEQVKKAAVLVPDEPHGAERVFNKGQDIAEKLFYGSPLRLQFCCRQWTAPVAPLELDGLPTGAGLAMGPFAEWKSPSDLSLNLYAAGSPNGSYLGAAGLHKYLPDQSLRISVEGVYANARRLDFYGEGQGSVESDRTRYDREQTSAIFRTRWQPPRKHIVLGVEIGELFYNVGPASGRFPSTDEVFGPSEAPGIQEQTNFLRSGASIELDFRNVSLRPTKGTHAFLGFRRYSDKTKERYSFNRLAAAVEHYISFLNEKRVIALHAATQLSYHDTDQIVPFYLQPTLGGPYALRGFGRYRFNDNNAVEAIAEYRWEVSTGFEWVLFADAGRVFEQPGNIGRLSHLKSSAGFGVRFNARERVALRIDTGFSSEGVQTWFQFSNVF